MSLDLILLSKFLNTRNWAPRFHWEPPLVFYHLHLRLWLFLFRWANCLDWFLIFGAVLLIGWPQRLNCPLIPMIVVSMLIFTALRIHFMWSAENLSLQPPLESTWTPYKSLLTPSVRTLMTNGDVATNLALHGSFSGATDFFFFFFFTTNETIFHLIFPSEAASSWWC